MESAPSFGAALEKRHGLSHLEEIGRGGMGVVFKAYDANLDRHVAVKQLSGDLSDDPSAKSRFSAEMKTLARVSHSAVVSIHTSGITDDGSAYFTMDYVEGRNLGQIINDRKQWGKAFTIEEVVEYLRPIALALDHLHLKMEPPIIHRDVKPANILVPTGGGFEARSLLTDFGISLTGDDTRLTSLSVVAGTQKYTAPELYPGEINGSDGMRSSSPDAASDNYSLALVALEMLTMRSLKDTMSEEEWKSSDRPFPELEKMGVSGTNPAGLEALKQLFHKALQPQPAYRHQTANEFIQELARAGDGWAVDNVPPSGRAEDAAATTASMLTVPPQNQNPQYAQQAAQWQQPPAPAPSPKKQGSWTTVGVLGVATVLLGVGVGGLGYYVAEHPAWGDNEATIAAAFPEAVPALENAGGWDDTVCEAAAAEEGEQARIVCSGEGTTVTYVDYGTVEARDEAFADGADRVGWETESCSVQSTTLSDEAYSIIPSDPVARFAAVIEGGDAAETRVEVPVC